MSVEWTIKKWINCQPFCAVPFLFIIVATLAYNSDTDNYHCYFVLCWQLLNHLCFLNTPVIEIEWCKSRGPETFVKHRISFQWSVWGRLSYPRSSPLTLHSGVLCRYDFIYWYDWRRSRWPTEYIHGCIDILLWTFAEGAVFSARFSAIR